MADVAEMTGQTVSYPMATPAAKRIPTVIVEDVHISYRVYGGGGAGSNPVASLRRMVTGTRSPSVREVHAVKGVSFVAHEGEAIGLIGTNGSGKSTVLRAIAGLLPASKGNIYTSGQPSLLGVNAALMPDLTGERNVQLGLLAMGMSKEEAKERTPEVIDFSGINERDEFSTLPMSTYSSGMAARLRFAIASSRNHDVLLIDEALATGDAQFQAKSEKRMREMTGSAGTVFLVSHSMGSIREMCDRTIWLESGVIRMDGPTDDVVHAYEEYTGAR